LSIAAADGSFTITLQTEEGELFEPAGLGSALLIRISNTYDFGIVISASLGGENADLYVDSFKKGSAYASASTELNDEQVFLKLFKSTLSYKNFTADGNLISDDNLMTCFASFIELVNSYSSANSNAPFVIEELVVNPLVIKNGNIVAVSGFCRFSKHGQIPAPRPIEKIGKMLHPSSIGIIGVSGKKMNFGRIILKNIIVSGYDTSKMTAIKPGDNEEIDGVKVVTDLKSLTHKLDLFVVAVGADVVFDLIDEIIDTNAAESVLLAPGGLGETEASREPTRKMRAKINDEHKQGDGGPVFLGGNCLGIISHPGNYDTWFIHKEKLPALRKNSKRNTTMVSQSGAFMITRLNKNNWLDAAYLIAIGNQNDITHSDMVNYLADRENLDVIGVYVKGFSEPDGLVFAKAVKKAILNNKLVIVYKAGQTAAGQGATMGHTASIAGDYANCESMLSQAGARQEP